MSTGRIVSTNTKVTQICSMADGDLNEWEDGFCESLSRQTDNGKNVGNLTDTQLEIIDKIWGKHFA